MVQHSAVDNVSLHVQLRDLMVSDFDYDHVICIIVSSFAFTLSLLHNSVYILILRHKMGQAFGFTLICTQVTLYPCGINTMHKNIPKSRP